MVEFDLNRRVLSDVVFFDKYARYDDSLKRRETWTECVDRNKAMHIKKFPELKDEIDNAYIKVYENKVLPSMRSLQFAGKAIELNNMRLFNCAYLPVDDVHAFSETMLLLLGGSGVGYSVQNHHIDKLPTIKKLKKEYKYLVQDSIEGWADAIKILMRAYFEGKTKPRFDLSHIRKKGTRLITSGGKAPGPEPLRICLAHIESILEEKEVDSKLTSLEVHSIMCHIADAVLAGGIRRASLICFFDRIDKDMLYCKFGRWWETNPHFGRANNSAVFLRGRETEQDFIDFWNIVKENKTGDPGIFWTNDLDVLSNPCVEAGLDPNTFCNLAELNAFLIDSQSELDECAYAASFIGTLQASYTDFHYLRPIWKEKTEESSLIGVGITGLANKEFLALDLEKAAFIVNETNRIVVERIGIKRAARCTLIKPSGTTSLKLGCSSGLHDWHSDYYIRRMKIIKNTDLYWYLQVNCEELMEDDWEKPHLQAVLSIPIKAPEDAILRTQTTPIELLDRAKDLYQRWIYPGFNRGENGHSASITVSIKDNEWDQVGSWMWENREIYGGIAVMPFDIGDYKQTPFEEINKERYDYLTQFIHEIDLTKIIEEADNTELTGEIACAGGACLI